GETARLREHKGMEHDGRPSSDFPRRSDRTAPASRYEGRHLLHVAHVVLAEAAQAISLLTTRAAGIGPHQHRIAGEREQRGPLQEETSQYEYEGDVLRVTHACIHALPGKPTLTLCPIQHGPGCRQEPEPAADQDETRQVEWTEMR